MPNKIELNLELDRLNSGFLITKNENFKIGVHDEKDLENKVKQLLSDQADVKNLLYFSKMSKVKLTLTVEYFK